MARAVYCDCIQYQFRREERQACGGTRRPLIDWRSCWQQLPESEGGNCYKARSSPRYQLRRFATRCSRLQRCAGAWRSCAFCPLLAPIDVIARLARRASYVPTSIIAPVSGGNFENRALLEKQATAAIGTQYLGHQLWSSSPQCVAKLRVQRGE